MSLLRIFLVILLALPGLAAAQKPVLELREAWVRALPPGQPTTAAYLTLVNNGTQAVEITGASAEGAGRVEIHASREVDGLVRMEQLATLRVEAGDQLALAPGGTHLMLFELERMPSPGESVQLCLQLRSAQSVCTPADVRKSAEEHGHHHH